MALKKVVTHFRFVPVADGSSQKPIIDYQPAVAYAGARAGVAATADRGQNFTLAGEADAGSDVFDARAVGDRPRMFVDEAVPDLASGVVRWVGTGDDLAADTAAEYLRGAAVEWIFHVDATAPELNQNAAHFPLAVARTRTREGRGNAPRLVHDQFEA